MLILAQGLDFGDDLPRMIIALAVAACAAVWVVCLIGWMVQAELDVRAGLGGVFVAFALMALAIWPPHPAVSAIVLIVIVATAAFFPYAYYQSMRREHSLLDTEELVKAHQAFAEHPDNLSAKFQIARALQKHGMIAHAVTVAEEAAGRLSTDVDPVSNRSQRDMFDREIREARMWRESLRPADAAKPLLCPECHAPNPPGVIACRGCNRPYLLDLARKGNVHSRFVTKLVAGWTIVAFVVPTAAYVGYGFSGSGQLFLMLAIIGGAGVALGLIFRGSGGHSERREL